MVHFLGRLDRQVKVDGHRVELDAVEAALRRTASVSDAAAFLVPLGPRPALVAAVVLEDSVPADAVRTGMAARSPRHMVPRRLFELAEFPRTANGKTDLRRLRQLVLDRLTTSASRRHADAESPEATAVRAAWDAHLGTDGFASNENFYDAGGTSLDAIAVVAELQARGYPIRAGDFTAAPTIAGLAQRLRSCAERKERGPVWAGRQSGSRLAPAQARFFRRRLPEADHWNQVLLLESDVPVQPAVLEAAVHDVLATHPLLRTAFRERNGVVHATPMSTSDGCFSRSRVPDHCLGEHVRETARQIHSAIRLCLGAVFRVHLFTVDGGPDRILFVCHHAAVDMVSWRVLVDDLIRSYEARLAGRGPAPVAQPTFWDWVDHLDQHADDLAADRVDGAGDPNPDLAGNLESASRSVWIALTPDATDAVTRALANRLGVQPHAAVLGAFAHALTGRRSDVLRVDVESHGRLTLDETVDVSRMVGWFTAEFPVAVATGADVGASIGAAAAALGAVPHLGLAHAYRAARGQDPRARVCYNYLGRIDFPRAARLPLRPCPLPTGPARGDANNRGHELKLTARLLAGSLVLDLSFPSPHTSTEDMAALLTDTRQALLSLAGVAEPQPAPVIEDGSTTGVLTYAPAALRLGGPRTDRAYRRVLLTGATGYVGVHLLRSLLAKTDTHVVCLVRDGVGGTAGERLAALYRWYFPTADRQVLTDRCTVLSADVTRPRFGLTPAVHTELAASVDAVYHLAGDTRLFGPAEAFTACNVDAVRTVLAFAEAARPKDVHHVSTLAVGGINPGGAPGVFDETSLDVGQRFNNDYERTKYEAEKLVHAFRARGGAGFVYRLGNVTGDSRTGRFQRNAADNRVVQVLRALVSVGELPCEPVAGPVLDHADTVAAAILALSRHAGVTPGTYHLAGSTPVPFDHIVRALDELGHRLRPSGARDLRSLFARSGDPDVAVARFWAQRPARGVRLDNTATQRLLDTLGVRFTPPDHTWLKAYLRCLIRQGVIPLPSGRRLVARKEMSCV